MTDTKAVTMTKHLRCPLTAKEENEKKDELVRTLNDLKRLEAHFATLHGQHKATVKARQTTINELSEDLGNGFIMRPVACRQQIDVEKNTMTTYRVDNGEKVDERALTGEEAAEARKKSVKT